MPKRKSELRNSSITVENIEHLDLDSMTNEEINEMFDNWDESSFVNIPVVPDDVDSGDESNHAKINQAMMFKLLKDVIIL